MTSAIAQTAQLPDDLARNVRRITLLGDDAQVEFHPQAQTWLENRLQAARPGTREQCHEWMTILLHGINASESGSDARERAIWMMCHDLPGFVWRQKTIKD